MAQSTARHKSGKPRSPALDRRRLHPPRRTASRSAWSRSALGLLIAVACGWAYATSFRGAFVFDDFGAIVHNPNIRALSPLSRALSAPPDTTLSGRPVASLTFALNYALAPGDARDTFEPEQPGEPAGPGGRFARNAWGYHAVNLAIHIAAALALFGVVRRTLVRGRLRPDAGPAADALAGAVALLWAVHPLQAESVTYIVQRVEALMGLFALLTLYCAIRSTTSPRPRVWTAAALVAYGLALGSKESAIAVPIAIVAWDFLFLAPVAAADVQSRVWRPRWLLYPGLVVVTSLLLFTARGARTLSVGFWLEGWTPWTYLLTQTRVVVHYLRLAIWPSPLVLDPHWPMARAAGEVAWPAAFLILLGAFTVIGLFKRRAAAFAGIWFFVFLAPTSSVLPIVTEVAAEHRMYLPLAAVVAVAVLGAYAAARSFLQRAGASGRATRVATLAGTAALLVVAVLLGAETRARNRDYATDEHIWRDTILKQPHNARARTALGANLVLAGRYQEAEAELLKAFEIDPGRPETIANLGAAELGLGKLDASVAHLERAIALRPEYAVARRNLAEAYLARRQDALAARQFRWCVDAQPDDPVLLKKLGLLLAVSSDEQVRDGAAALRLTERAVLLTSRRDAASLAALAAALAEVERYGEAGAAVREALALTPPDSGLARELSHLLDAYSAGRKIRRPSR